MKLFYKTPILFYKFDGYEFINVNDQKLDNSKKYYVGTPNNKDIFIFISLAMYLTTKKKCRTQLRGKGGTIIMTTNTP